MATQGERRRQAIAAMRVMYRNIRHVKAALDKALRRAHRLTLRKTLIGPDSIVTLGQDVDAAIRLGEQLQKSFADIATIVASLPR